MIKEKAKNSVFSFYEVDKDKIKKEINRLNKNKASQKSDIPIKIIHDNVDIFADFIAESFKGAIKTSNFSNYLKLADITPLHKKGEKPIRKTIGQLVFYQHYQKYLKRYSLNKYRFSLISFYQTNNVGSEKDIALNFVF